MMVVETSVEGRAETLYCFPKNRKDRRKTVV